MSVITAATRRPTIAAFFARSIGRSTLRLKWPARVLLPLICGLGIIGGLPGATAQTLQSSEWPRTDFSRHLVPLDEIRAGGPPRDGIPAIDEPRFVDTTEAIDWLDPDEPVIVVSVGEQTRAYPIQILIWHEIVNDTLGDVPIAVTFCPLCNASIVFERTLGERVLDFGTTGRLRKSDLVMYDRQSESWWQQFSGRAIVGELAGERLPRVPARIVSFKDFRTAFPKAQVLSRDTGHRRSYGHNPYRGYDSIDARPFLFTDPLDPRLPAMERVLSITLGTRPYLYPFSRLRQEPVINDKIDEQPVVVLSSPGTYSALDQSRITQSRKVLSAVAYHRSLDGRTLSFIGTERGFKDEQTGSIWDLLGRAVAGPLRGSQLQPVAGGVHFAFAWLAFNPDSEIRAGH
ncbi:MAG: DUF3179 domain-containing protein [Gammaproteobacteria bacterium]|nr:DUF3179 domain-containing protein [Gammaproteobacteria bacterium]